MAVRAPSDLELRARLLRALADPSRLALLDALGDGERRVVDLVRISGLSQPNVSKHLANLLDCGLVERDKRGREAYYRPIKGLDHLLEATDAFLQHAGPSVADCSDGCAT